MRAASFEKLFMQDVIAFQLVPLYMRSMVVLASLILVRLLSRLAGNPDSFSVGTRDMMRRISRSPDVPRLFTART